MTNSFWSRCVHGLLISLLGGSLGWAAKAPVVPDLTRGGKADANHDWNLGPTGARGWIWGWKLETTDSRQILITSVAPGSPADGLLRSGDVILGVEGRPFERDARKSFGNAVTAAETKEGEGTLVLVRWRAGKVRHVTLRLAVLGSYHDRSPWNCEKSARIVKAGCAHIASNLTRGIDGKINALALLASGEERYASLVRTYVRNLAPSNLDLNLAPSSSMAAWHWGYTNLLLTEYFLATGDQDVLPAIHEYTTKIAEGQSGVGTWGHAMAWPQWNEGKKHGRLGGYGALNQAGLVCQLSLVLGVKCGADDPVVHQAVERGNTFFGFYIGKGAIPYGDHRPNWDSHDDNGKNSIAAVLFDAQDHRAGAQFFSRMTVASYGERERGHTGNYFSFLWGGPGAMRAGAEAAAAYLKEQRWFFELNREYDGSFHYQGGAASSGAEHKYGHWDCTGAFLLSYLLPKQKLFISGKGTKESNVLRGPPLATTIAAGRGYDSWEKGTRSYRALSLRELLEATGNWSPAVRARAAIVLAEQEDAPVGKLVDRLDATELNVRYGACQALAALGKRGAPAVNQLQALLWNDDVWLRIQASHALAAIGAPAKVAIPDLLALATRSDEADPREMTQRYLAFCLFYRGGALKMKGLLAGSVEGIDLGELRPAVERLLKNPDGRARGAVGSLYKHLSYEEVKPFLPAVHEAIVEPAPSGVMFASGIRLQGLELLARHRIAEGVPLCLQVMEIETWGKRDRIMKCLKILGQYGGAAKPIVPSLRELQKQLRAHREARALSQHLAEVAKLIAQIENEPAGEPLRSLTD
ncbi:MAG: DUF6288 domain-containing protein [Akkermansiaceae bacterium]